MKWFARLLRKLADLLDPNVEPSETLTIRVNVDSSDVEAAFRGLTATIDDFLEKTK